METYVASGRYLTLPPPESGTDESVARRANRWKIRGMSG